MCLHFYDSDNIKTISSKELNGYKIYFTFTYSEGTNTRSEIEARGGHAYFIYTEWIFYFIFYFLFFERRPNGELEY